MKSPFKPLLRFLPAVFCFWFITGLCAHLYARAGGAGGGGGHGGGGGGHSSGGGGFGGGSSFNGSGSGSYLPFSPGFIILIVIIFVIYKVIQSQRAGSSNEDTSETEVDAGSLNAFLASHPGFDFTAFNNRVCQAFLKIQQAWTAQDVAGVRVFISDGMYQRFVTQFHMMALLQQVNRLENIRVEAIEPVSARIDGPYDVIDVRVQASMRDSFVCGLDHSLDEEDDNSFVEYWSFIRKTGATNKEGYDIFTGETCPSCGGVLPKDMGEICRCEHCKVLVNSGDFDWVLAEITQEGDYGSSSAMMRHVSPELPAALGMLATDCPDFSVQMAEDKASNAFMQLMTATATRKPAAARRFVSDEMFTSFAATLPERDIVFDRIYLNEAVLLNAWRAETKHRLQFGLLASMRRVELLPDGRISHLDEGERRSMQVLVMERDVDSVPQSGSLYQHQCPSCGGAIGDTIDVKCQYCGTPLNSTRGEWIVCSCGAPE